MNLCFAVFCKFLVDVCIMGGVWFLGMALFFVSMIKIRSLQVYLDTLIPGIVR